MFVFDAESKFAGDRKPQRRRRILQTATGIAAISSRRLYVSDTLRHKDFVLDLEGTCSDDRPDGRRRRIHFPTELRLAGDELSGRRDEFSRTVLDRSGVFRYAIALWPTAAARVSTEGHRADSETLVRCRWAWGVCRFQITTEQLLYYFGQSGDALALQPAVRIFIDRGNLI